MPTKWMPCDGNPVPDDIYRWREPAWKPKARKTSKSVIIGEREITARLTKSEGDWLEFELIECQTTNAELWAKRIPELKVGELLRRRRRVFLTRNPERRPWGGKDGESARAIIAASAASKFLS